MSEKTKDVLLRAGKTFVQAFLGDVITNLALFQDALGDFARLKSIGIAVAAGALAAGVCAAWNGVLAPLFETKKVDAA